MKSKLFRSGSSTHTTFFVSVIFLKFLLEPSKQPILIFWFSQKGWNLAGVITFGIRLSSRIKVKTSSVYFLPVKNKYFL